MTGLLKMLIEIVYRDAEDGLREHSSRKEKKSQSEGVEEENVFLKRHLEYLQQQVEGVTLHNKDLVQQV